MVYFREFSKSCMYWACSIVPKNMHKFMNIEQLLISLGSKAQTTFQSIANFLPFHFHLNVYISVCTLRTNQYTDEAPSLTLHFSVKNIV